MLDRYVVPLLKKPLAQMAKPLRSLGISPDQVTVTGFVTGLAAVPALAGQWYGLALGFIVFSRLCDGLDGALARLGNQSSDAGGFLDITLDFIFYSAVIVGFALADPTHNALAATVLIFSFIGTGSSFLAFAAMAQKYQLDDPVYTSKSLYYIGGLAEGTETIAFYVLCCLLPGLFPVLAYSFAAICMITAAMRIIAGYRMIRAAER